MLEVCWRMLEDVGGCLRYVGGMLEDVGGRWRMLEVY